MISLPKRSLLAAVARVNALALTLAALFFAAASAGLSGSASAQGSYSNLQKIGCYYNPADKRIWIAAVALNDKYKDPNFYNEEGFSIIVRAGDNKFPIDGNDVLVHPMGSFNYKGAEKYQFMKYSLVVDYSSSIPDTVRTDVLNFLDVFVKAMPLAVEGQLIRFSDRVEKFAFTNNLNDVRAQLRAPIGYGMTALHDALMESVSALTQQGGSTPFRVIVLFTDGYDTSSQQYKDRAGFVSSFTSLTKAQRIAVVAIGVTTDRDEALLKEITDPSKGFAGYFLPVQDFNQLGRALDQVKVMITNTVLFRMPKVGPDKGKIDITMGTKSKAGNFTTFQTFECEY